MLLLGSALYVVAWFLPLAGWQENFLKFGAFIFVICSPIVYWSWPDRSSLGTAYFLVGLGTIGVSLVMACPFVTQGKAKGKARKFAEENLHGATSIQIGAAKLDDWTWIVNGWCIQTYTAPIQFWVNVHAKTGTPSNLRYKE